MNIKCAKFVYFSPTRTTEKVINKIASSIKVKKDMYNFTPFHKEYRSIDFDSDELLVIGIPVYSGRIPVSFEKRIAYLKGKNTPAVLVATYGNRAYDDSLIELKTLLVNQGFIPVGAAAFVTEHNCYRELATGRPNEKDMLDIEKFSKGIVELLNSKDSFSGYNLYVKGNMNYREYRVMPIHPHSTEKCNLCRICAKVCPSGAIPLDNPSETNNSKCICCMGCVNTCPNKARELYDEQVLGAKAHLSKYIETKNHEYFMLQV